MAALLAGMSFYMFSAALPLYLNRFRGYSLATVGILIGLASVVQVIATLFAGPLLDRRGARLAMRLGAACYLVASLLFLISAWLPAIVLARVLQGIGIALVLPSVFSLVPALVAQNSRGLALGLVGAFNNVALAAGPPLGLLFLEWDPAVLFLAGLVAASLALAISWFLRVGLAAVELSPLLKYRAAWTPLYVITFLCVVYWGVVTAFLPIEVPSREVANVGWFFTADALAVMAARVPAGYLADRFGPRWLLVSGACMTAVAIGALLVAPSFVSLVLAGIGTGVSAALLLPPILLELTKRSDDRDRGTAMALYTTSFAAAVGAGSLGGTLIVEWLGFHASLVLSIASTLAAVPVALATVRQREDR
jgi:MFS family permease